MAYTEHSQKWLCYTAAIIMHLRNLRSAMIGLLLLMPFGIAIYHWQQDRFLRPSDLGANKIVTWTSWLAASAYFLWHGFRGQGVGTNKRDDSLATCILASILAIAFTFSGLWHEYHALKVVIVTYLYSVAVFYFWRSYKVSGSSSRS